MIELTFSEVAKVTNGELMGDDGTFNCVNTDSRNIDAGALFVALIGQNFNAHDYVQQAVELGACAVLVSEKQACDCTQILVKDTQIALGQMAKLWRTKSHAKIIALTGSNGKTTVKEMVRSILGISHQVHATKGNMNNEIGLPLTILNIQLAEFVVLEMGAAKKGDIDYLTDIAKPDIALLNNAGIAHLAGFGDEETVARTKAEIINGLNDDGTFIYDADSKWRPLWRDLGAGKRLISFGFNDDADIRSAKPAQTILNEMGFIQKFSVITPDSLIHIELPLAGKHNHKNALAACAVAWQLGIHQNQIQQGLNGMRPVAGRLNPSVTPKGVHLIDDSYNANPSSLRAAIDVLASFDGEKILVLGQMAELGKDTAKHHIEIAEYAKQAGIHRLYGYGEDLAVATEIFADQGFLFQSKEALIKALQTDLKADDLILVKGSRSAGMEVVVQALSGEIQQ